MFLFKEFRHTSEEHRSQMTAMEVEGLSKKDKGLMDMDNSVVIAGGHKGTKRYWKNMIKIIYLKHKNVCLNSYNAKGMKFQCS